MGRNEIALERLEISSFPAILFQPCPVDSVQLVDDYWRTYSAPWIENADVIVYEVDGGCLLFLRKKKFDDFANDRFDVYNDCRVVLPKFTEPFERVTSLHVAACIIVKVVMARKS